MSFVCSFIAIKKAEGVRRRLSASTLEYLNSNSQVIRDTLVKFGKKKLVDSQVINDTLEKFENNIK